MDIDPQSYILSEEESRSIFERDILPSELSHLSAATPQPSNSNEIVGDRTPLAVLLIGQTGAGKTRAAPALKGALTRLRGASRLAHFVADTYKTFHPAYNALLASRPALASAATGPDARRWLATAASRAASRRADVLVESAARHPGDFADLARLFHASGYRVEVAVLAVPAALSRLGILARFYEKLPEAGPRGGLPLRLTPRKVHDESYAGVLEAAAFVDSSGAVDQVVVVRRDSLVAYANERIKNVGGYGNGWRQVPRTAEAVRTERERPLTASERTAAELSLQRLRKMNVPGLESQLIEIERMLEPLLVAPHDLTQIPLKPLPLPNSIHNGKINIEIGLSFGNIPPM
ncbi:zeta toxin-domain-containing protein [Daldinia caldariorum]|uniref:zeta toxin-domain-containing protein n=1 Tax=Daldinia caldariorum TaxID=326644 RepID=UPI0020077412|nr:zeta toxin-domain-containing protein [Daldinia caldariorum]KAI1467123.1 zeta toxin-domain-containing protein [Daldinia caldariorum]